MLCTTMALLELPPRCCQSRALLATVCRLWSKLDSAFQRLQVRAAHFLSTLPFQAVSFSSPGLVALCRRLGLSYFRKVCEQQLLTGR